MHASKGRKAGRKKHSAFVTTQYWTHHTPQWVSKASHYLILQLLSTENPRAPALISRNRIVFVWSLLPSSGLGFFITMVSWWSESCWFSGWVVVLQNAGTSRRHSPYPAKVLDGSCGFGHLWVPWIIKAASPLAAPPPPHHQLRLCSPVSQNKAFSRGRHPF